MFALAYRSAANKSQAATAEEGESSTSGEVTFAKAASNLQDIAREKA